MSKIEELRARLKADPGSRHFYYLGEELRKAGQHQEAIAVLRQGLTAQPAYASAWIGLGRTLKDLGQHEEAIASLKKGFELDPSNAVPARLLAESYLAVGNKLEAIKKFKFFNAVMPGDEAVEEVIERLERELAAPVTAEPSDATAEVSPADDAGTLDGNLVDEASGIAAARNGSDAHEVDGADSSAESLEQNEADGASPTAERLFEEIEQPFDASTEDERDESYGDQWVTRSDVPEETVFEEGDPPDTRFDQLADDTISPEPISARPSAENLFGDDEMPTGPASLHGGEESQPDPLSVDSSHEAVFEEVVEATPDSLAGEHLEKGEQSEPISSADETFASDGDEMPDPDAPFSADQAPLAEVIAWRARSEVRQELEATEEPELGSEKRFGADRSSDEVENVTMTSLGDHNDDADASDARPRREQVVSRLENWLSTIRRDRDV